ncbi:MAG: hypothetical protein ACRD8W_26655 [Nitrososphaeraceae archaeon]
MILTTIRLLDEYNITFEGRSRIFVDGANPSFIRALKEAVDEATATHYSIPKETVPMIWIFYKRICLSFQYI